MLLVSRFQETIMLQEKCALCFRLIEIIDNWVSGYPQDYSVTQSPDSSIYCVLEVVKIEVICDALSLSRNIRLYL